jgi:aryl-alcohol dehydrogenase-like predicted oxidoreductase
MPELALRFILGNDDVSTIIPGMRKLRHVESNIATSDAGPLPEELQEKMRGFRWVRKPAPWSQ